MDATDICPEHDTRLSENGCWVCGHSAALDDDEHWQFVMWMGVAIRHGLVEKSVYRRGGGR